MCVCFHGEGRNPGWKYIQNTSCKEHLVFSNYFLPGCAGVNTGHYQSTALLWFYGFSVPSSYHQLLGSEKVNWNDIFCEKTSYRYYTSPFLSSFDGLLLRCCLWDWVRNTCQWLGRCLDQAPWSCGGTDCPSFWLWHCWGTERAKPNSQMQSHLSAFQLRWWLPSEQILCDITWEAMGENKHIKYK